MIIIMHAKAVGEEGKGKKIGKGERIGKGGREEGLQEIKLKNGRVGKEIRLVATLYALDSAHAGGLNEQN